MFTETVVLMIYSLNIAHSLEALKLENFSKTFLAAYILLYVHDYSQ